MPEHVYQSAYITTIEINVSVHDSHNKLLRGRLWTIRGASLQHVIRNLLVKAKQNPEMFPQGLVSINEHLDPPFQVKGLLDNVPDELAPARPKPGKKKGKVCPPKPKLKLKLRR